MPSPPASGSVNPSGTVAAATAAAAAVTPRPRDEPRLPRPARPAWALVALLLAALVASAGANENDEQAKAISKAANAGISIMLLGSVAFMMGLFYLVNHPDKDMVKYSWQVISSTISIFSAVLLFQAVNGIVENLFLEGASEGFELFISMAHFLIWFAGLELVLAYLAGALAKEAIDFTPQREEKMERQIKCYAVLMGHITGFAAINAFGVLQQQVPRSVGSVFMVAPASWVVVYLLSQVTAHLRDHIAVGDDGKVDRAEELWDEETEETEDDVIGLAVSFLAVQTLRLAFGGDLPNAEGEEGEEASSQHTDFQTFKLLAVGVALVFVEFFRTMYIRVQIPRVTNQMRNVIMMIFAWCMFFGLDWFISAHFFVTEHGMIKEVVLALVVTSMSMSVIFLLDKIADMPATGEAIDHAIHSVVRALGILIGFGWEKAFDTAVASVTETVTVLPEPVTKLILAVALAALVVPAWRHYILPSILEYDKQDEEEEEAFEEELENGEEGGGAAGEAKAPAEAKKDLAQPLLATGQAPAQAGSKKQAPSSGKKGGSGGGEDKAALKAKCEGYENHIKALEQRNAKLEASLSDFVLELNDLQKMADILKRSPASFDGSPIRSSP